MKFLPLGSQATVTIDPTITEEKRFPWGTVRYMPETLWQGCFLRVETYHGIAFYPWKSDKTGTLIVRQSDFKTQS